MKSYTLPLSTLVLFVFLLASCWEKTPAPNPSGERSETFESAPQRIAVAPGQVDEASGLSDSRTIEGYLWTHEDAGSITKLFLMSKDGKDIRTYVPPGIINRDWEDIAIGEGPAPGISYLYIGDIGNNDANPAVTSQYIYRMPELKSLDASIDPSTIETFTYRYPDSPRDAETLLYDPATKDLFVVSKELDKANLYRIPYPQPTAGVVTAELIGSIPSIIIATGGDISADGKEIIIRTYTNVYYWKRKEGETVGQTLSRAPRKSLPYELEPQGEAVCFDKEMKGYYTFSEKRTANAVTLNYYKRK